MVIGVAPATAEDSVKLAYVDPLSGGGASIGEVGLKTFNYLADVTNAQGGIAGRKLEVVPYDNKLNAQETLVQVQKAIDSGIRFVTRATVRRSPRRSRTSSPNTTTATPARKCCTSIMRRSIRC